MIRGSLWRLLLWLVASFGLTTALPEAKHHPAEDIIPAV